MHRHVRYHYRRPLYLLYSFFFTFREDLQVPLSKSLLFGTPLENAVTVRRQSWSASNIIGLHNRNIDLNLLNMQYGIYSPSTNANKNKNSVEGSVPRFSMHFRAPASFDTFIYSGVYWYVHLQFAQQSGLEHVRNSWKFLCSYYKS